MRNNNNETSDDVILINYSFETRGKVHSCLCNIDEVKFKVAKRAIGSKSLGAFFQDVEETPWSFGAS